MSFVSSICEATVYRAISHSEKADLADTGTKLRLAKSEFLRRSCLVYLLVVYSNAGTNCGLEEIKW